MWVSEDTLMRDVLPMLFVVVRTSRVIVHHKAGRRPSGVGRERLGMRSVRGSGPCDRNGTSAVSTLDYTSRTLPRKSPGAAASRAAQPER
jgi:lysophospholipid acyltransferase (LPLAT)-like uncharacterized protein